MRRGAKLPQGLTPYDFRTPSSIMSALGSDKAVREEYSRQRSIIRKRVERMAAAGETSNQFYKRFGNLAQAMPSAKGLSTKEMMTRLAASSRAIGGGYQSTMTAVKQARKETQERIRQQAEEEGDDETAEFFSKPLTPKQTEKANRIWGIVRAVMGKSLGKSIGSDGMEKQIYQTVVEGGQSVLSMAAAVMSHYDADIAELETLKERFTQTGKTRVAWSKAHGRKRR